MSQDTSTTTELSALAHAYSLQDEDPDIANLVAAHIAVGNTGILLHPEHKGYMKPPAGVSISAPQGQIVVGATATEIAVGHPGGTHAHYLATSPNPASTGTSAAGIGRMSTIAHDEAFPVKAGGSILSRSWKRGETYNTYTSTISNSIVNVSQIFKGEIDGITQLKDLVTRITVDKGINGFLRFFWMKWNSDLLTNLTPSVALSVAEDYRINRRERTVPIFKDRQSFYESRFPTMLLRSDVRNLDTASANVPLVKLPEMEGMVEVEIRSNG